MTDQTPAADSQQVYRYVGGTAAVCGKPIKLKPIGSYDQALQVMGTIARKAALGELEIEAASKLTQIIERMVGVMWKRRQHELETRRLDLLGAAAEQGAAVFEGFAIIPPPSREAVPHSKTEVQPPQAPTLEHGPALEIKKPRPKK